MAGGRVGTVRFSAAPTAITGHNLAERLAEFAWAHPKIRTELRESTSVPILHDLYQGRLDLGIVSTNVRLPSGLEGQAWRDDRLVVVVPIGHPLEKRRSVRFVDVLDHSMVETLADGALALLLADRARQLGRRPQYRYHRPR